MISEFLRKRLKELKLSQGDLTAELNLRGFSITRASIGHWVSGRNNPPLDDPKFVAALASSLQMSEEKMLAEMGILQSLDQHSNDAQFAASIIERLPREARELAIEYLKMLERRYVFRE